LVEITGIVAVPVPWSATDTERGNDGAFSKSFQVFIFPTVFNLAFGLEE